MSGQDDVVEEQDIELVEEDDEEERGQNINQVETVELLTSSKKKFQLRGLLALAVCIPSVFILIVALINSLSFRVNQFTEIQDGSRLKERTDYMFSFLKSLADENNAVEVSDPALMNLRQTQTDDAVTRVFQYRNRHPEERKVADLIRMDLINEVRLLARHQGDSSTIHATYETIATTAVTGLAKNVWNDKNIFRVFVNAWESVGYMTFLAAPSIQSYAFSRGVSYYCNDLLRSLLNENQNATFVSSPTFTIPSITPVDAATWNVLSSNFTSNWTQVYNNARAPIAPGEYEWIWNANAIILGTVLTCVFISGLSIVLCAGSYVSVLIFAERERAFDRVLQNHEATLIEINEFADMMEDMNIDSLAARKSTTSKETEVCARALATTKELSPFLPRTLTKVPKFFTADMANENNTVATNVGLCTTDHGIIMISFDVSPFHQGFATAGKKQKTFHHNVVHIATLLEEEFEQLDGIVRLHGTYIYVYVGIYETPQSKAICDAVLKVQSKASAANMGHIRATVAYAEPNAVKMGNVGSEECRAFVVLGKLEQETKILSALNRIHDTYCIVSHSISTNLKDSVNVQLRPLEFISLDDGAPMDVCELSRKRDREDEALSSWRKVFELFNQGRFAETVTELMEHTKIHGSNPSSVRLSTLAKQRHKMADMKDLLTYDMFLADHT